MGSLLGGFPERPHWWCRHDDFGTVIRGRACRVSRRIYEARTFAEESSHAESRKVPVPEPRRRRRAQLRLAELASVGLSRRACPMRLLMQRADDRRENAVMRVVRRRKQRAKKEVAGPVSRRSKNFVAGADAAIGLALAEREPI
jgi:hypothetical protein